MASFVPDPMVKWVVWAASPASTILPSYQRWLVTVRKFSHRTFALVMDLPDQLMTIQMAFEEFLEEEEAVLWRHGVKAEAGPRFGRAFNDKRARLSPDHSRGRRAGPGRRLRRRTVRDFRAGV